MLKNLTPTIRDLLPSLMGGVLPVGDGGGSASEVLRPVCARSSTRSTYVIPADFPTNTRAWFSPDAPTYPIREGNDVELLIDGEPTFEAMIEAIETATGPEHFIVLLAWTAHLDFPLVKSSARTASLSRSAEMLFEERAELGVKTRFLIWRNGLPPHGPGNDIDEEGNLYSRNTKLIADKWNEFAPDEMPRRSITIVDDRTQTTGSHHQKILLVYGQEGLIGFLGGVDFNSDRVNQEPIRLIHPEMTNPVRGPLHDVHARLRGPAAEDLLVLAVNRWNFAHPADVITTDPDEPYEDPGFPPGLTLSPNSGVHIEDLSHLLEKARKGRRAAPEPHHIVQIAQTVGNPVLAKIQDKNGVLPTVEDAIATAREFIYVEDQYFWSQSAADALLERLDSLRHVTILTCSDSDLSPMDRIRHALLRKILESNPRAHEKLRLYERTGLSHGYVHAKMSIFDDELAIVGSANWNDRGFFNDSEVIAAIVDPSWDDPAGPRYGRWHILEANAAKKLRLQLWAEHLGVETDRLVDGVAAEIYWRDIPKGASVRPYLVDGQPWHLAPSVLNATWVDGGIGDGVFDPRPPGS